MSEDLWGFAFLAALVTLFGLEWFVRRRLLAHIQARMNTKADAQEHRPAAPLGEAGANRPAQVAAAGEVFVDYHGLHRVDETSMAARIVWEAGAVGLLKRVLKVDLTVAAAYLLLPGALAMAVGAGVVTGVLMGFVLALAQALTTSMIYAVYRQRYRAFDLDQLKRRPPGWLGRIGQWLAMAVIGLLVIVAGIALVASSMGAVIWLPRLLQPLWVAVAPRLRTLQCVVFAGLAVLFGVVGLLDDAAPAATFIQRIPSAGLAAAGLLHAAVFVAHGRRMRGISGSSLLVLRVFNIDAASAFTFNGLISHWRHFGHHFTVVDPSLVRQTKSHALGWGARLLLLATLTVILAAVPARQVLAALRIDPQAWDAGMQFGAYVLWVALAVAALTASTLATARWRLEGRFIRSREQLLQRLERLDRRPRHGDLSFRHERAPCHDDTWFMTVGEFARRARVVLMDLRGYSATNQGCQSEVDFLFDTVPVERIVFLVDVQTDTDRVEAMLAERWQEQRADSPNLGLEVPMLTVFMAGGDDKASMQALLDCLIHAAERRLEPRPVEDPSAAVPTAA